MVMVGKADDAPALDPLASDGPITAASRATDMAATTSFLELTLPGDCFKETPFGTAGRGTRFLDG